MSSREIEISQSYSPTSASDRELRLSGILTTASPNIFKQSTLLSTTGKLGKRLGSDGNV
jgi:hypothetical protein